MWVMKIRTATLADSPMPRMVRTIKTARTRMVAAITGRPCHSECTYCIASDAEITAVAM